MPISYRQYPFPGLVCALLLTTVPFCAWAQNVPSVADPSRLAPQTDTLKPQIEEVKPPHDESQRAVVVLDDASAKKTYRMQDLVVEGMTAYSNDEFKKQYQKYLGQKISLKQIYDMAAELQQRYVDDGFTLTKVQVPQQKDGMIRLTVIEGYVAEVEVKGTVRKSFVIDALVKQIKAMHPLNVKKLERLMLVMNDLPGVKMGSILATPKEAIHPAGAVRLILEETMMPRISGNLGINNYGSLYSGPWQAIGGISVAHVGMNYSALSLVSTIAQPISELGYGMISYEIPICGVSGTKLELSVTGAQNKPGEDLEELSVEGRSREASIGISYPIIRQRDETWRVNGTLSIENSRTDLLSDRLYDDRLRVLTLGSSYAFSDHFSGANALEVKYAQGFDIWGVRKSGSVDLSRAEGRSDFRKLQATFGRQQALPKNFEAYVAFDGQYTNDPLLSGQEFGFGGTQFGRGYDPSEITGDKGISASLELRYNTVFEKQKVIVQPYVFYDVGKVWNIDPNAKEKVSAASTGIGVRANTLSNWNGDINMAFPLTRPADNPPKYSTDKGIRILFSVGRTF